MSNTVFIHSLFRSGSTYFFNKLRNSGTFTCFYEPLHQDLIALRKKNIHTFWGFTPTSEVTTKQNHPKLTAPHFKEYETLFHDNEDTLPFFKKSYAFDEYSEVKSKDFKPYIDSLISLAKNNQSIPLLQFNRTTLRIDWFQKEYTDALNLVLLRNPKDQFESYLNRSENIFEIMNLLIIKNSLLFARLVKKYNLPIFDHSDFQKEKQYYAEVNDSLSLEVKYEIFFTIWIESLIHAVLYADEIILMDKISQNTTYVTEVKYIFEKHLKYLPNFDDFNMQSYTHYSLTNATLSGIEKTVLRNYNLLDEANDIYETLCIKNVKDRQTDVMQPPPFKPLVTVVTVSYNAVEDIERTIQSVTEQTYSNIEYIIIDGDSKDGTVDIIKKYEEKISHWISEPDDGIYYAMNKAIEVINGEWVNFMNAGDTFIDNNVIKNIVSQTITNSDIYYGSRYIQNGKNKNLDNTAPLDSFYYNMPFGHQATFIKKAILKKYQFDQSYQLSSDYDFFIKCYQDKYIFQNLEFPVCVFQAGGLSTTMRLKSVLETLKILNDHTDAETVKNSMFFSRTLKNIIIEETHMFAEQPLLKNDHKSTDIERYLNKLSKIKFLYNPLKKYKTYKKLMQAFYKHKRGAN